jgi:hypothetical protein
MLGSAADKSKLAAKTGSIDAARGGASSAFEKSAKADKSSLNKDQGGNSSAASGLNAGSAMDSLKNSDPGLNSNESTPPAPPAPTEDENSDEEMKQMIMNMILQATLGSMFGAMGQMMATAINPDYQSKPIGCPSGNYDASGKCKA